MSFNKNDINLEKIWVLEEHLKTCIENLICLGISTNTDENYSSIQLIGPAKATDQKSLLQSIGESAVLANFSANRDLEMTKEQRDAKALL
jgi:hypothetical protein